MFRDGRQALGGGVKKAEVRVQKTRLTAPGQPRPAPVPVPDCESCLPKIALRLYTSMAQARRLSLPLRSQPHTQSESPGDRQFGEVHGARPLLLAWFGLCIRERSYWLLYLAEALGEGSGNFCCSLPKLSRNPAVRFIGRPTYLSSYGLCMALDIQRSIKKNRKPNRTKRETDLRVAAFPPCKQGHVLSLMEKQRAEMTPNKEGWSCCV